MPYARGKGGSKTPEPPKWDAGRRHSQKGNSGLIEALSSSISERADKELQFPEQQTGWDGMNPSHGAACNRPMWWNDPMTGHLTHKQTTWAVPAHAWLILGPHHALSRTSDCSCHEVHTRAGIVSNISPKVWYVTSTWTWPCLTCWGRTFLNNSCN